MLVERAVIEILEYDPACQTLIIHKTNKTTPKPNKRLFGTCYTITMATPVNVTYGYIKHEVPVAMRYATRTRFDKIVGDQTTLHSYTYTTRDALKNTT